MYINEVHMNEVQKMICDRLKAIGSELNRQQAEQQNLLQHIFKAKLLTRSEVGCIETKLALHLHLD